MSRLQACSRRPGPPWPAHSHACRPILTTSPPASPPAACRPQADLERIRGLLLQRNGALVNMTADARTMAAAQPAIDEFLASLPATSAAAANWSGSLPRVNEAFTVPTQVRGLRGLGRRAAGVGGGAAAVAVQAGAVPGAAGRVQHVARLAGPGKEHQAMHQPALPVDSASTHLVLPI
jgi:hypothetical protein